MHYLKFMNWFQTDSEGWKQIEARKKDSILENKKKEVNDMILQELLEKYEDEKEINIFSFAEGDIFNGKIGQLKTSPLIAGDFRTSRTWHTISDWYEDVTGKLQVTM